MRAGCPSVDAIVVVGAHFGDDGHRVERGRRVRRSDHDRRGIGADRLDRSARLGVGLQAFGGSPSCR